jgi:hypothetical protein
MAKRKKSPKKERFGWYKEGEKFVYIFTKGQAGRFNLKKIDFIGFESRPVGLGLYKTGGGFNRRQSSKIGGDYILNYLKSRFGKPLQLSIYPEGTTKAAIKEFKTKTSIDLSYDDFLGLLQNLGDDIHESRDEVIRQRFAEILPKDFKSDDESLRPTNEILSQIHLADLLDTDHEDITSFIKRYISLHSENDKVLENLQIDLVIQGRKKTLDQVIRKFERHLKNRSFSEKKWQKFLHEEVFFFISNYIESIREADVNFGKGSEGAKQPDFVWIDIYGFLDVFEIKTPYTDILARRIDKSHNNFYFSSSAAMAISQIEKYILFLERNVDAFGAYLSKQTKIPFSILKPKAFLIIGNTREFEHTPQKKDDFRVLRRLFKNIEFVTFDELLDNLKNLSSKFEKAIETGEMSTIEKRKK